ncbi:MAG: thiamine-phosphate kinase [Deltaproteobacteria bacterium]|nr:thiamine-phosphate kinase [Deltaproteobacteria bacterium]
MNEEQRIARIATILGRDVAHVTLGIGDDAAVLAPSDEPLVWSIDAAVEHVHFERAWLDIEALGYRATMAALSDLAAMGARPVAVLAALVLPPSFADADLEALARGQRRAADELRTAIVGGNLARGGELSITTTVLGTTKKALARSGASPGQSVWLAGAVGLARAGLEALLHGIAVPDEHLEAWRRPRARIESGLAAAAVATAAIDVSDGLALDAWRLAHASDVALVIDRGGLIDEALEAAAARVGIAPLELALHGGEDYALLVTTPPDLALGAGFRRIGRVTARAAERRDDEPLVWLDDGASLVPVPPSGFDHFG